MTQPANSLREAHFACVLCVLLASLTACATAEGGSVGLDAGGDEGDECPDDPEKTTPGECGCGVLEGCEGTLSATRFSGDAGSVRHYGLIVPPDGHTVVITLSPGIGDVDLYVRSDELPTLELFDCRPYEDGATQESCRFAEPGAYYVTVRGRTAFSDWSLTGSHETGSPPSQLAITTTNDTMQYGNLMGGIPYQDHCPKGRVVVGLEGTWKTRFEWLTQLRVQCALPDLVDGDPDPTIEMTDESSLPLRGTSAGDLLWSQTCPPDQVVVGFTGRSDSRVNQLALTCAPLVVTGVVVSLGTTTELNPSGGSAGDPFPQTDCGNGRFATGANIRAGSDIDAFGLSCSSAVVVK